MLGLFTILLSAAIKWWLISLYIRSQLPVLFFYPNKMSYWEKIQYAFIFNKGTTLQCHVWIWITWHYLFICQNIRGCKPLMLKYLVVKWFRPWLIFRLNCCKILMQKQSFCYNCYAVWYSVVCRITVWHCKVMFRHVLKNKERKWIKLLHAIVNVFLFTIGSVFVYIVFEREVLCRFSHEITLVFYMCIIGFPTSTILISELFQNTSSCSNAIILADCFPLPSWKIQAGLCRWIIERSLVIYELYF